MLQNRAILNEYKGVLFEYLSAVEISSRYELSDTLISNIDSKKLYRYSHYEKLILLNEPSWMILIEQAAVKFTDELLMFLKLSKIEKVLNICLQGNQQSKNDKETDLLLETTSGNYLLSLKFYKSLSGVNTKSAGIFSLINTYFENYNPKLILTLQNDLCEFTYLNYISFMEEMFQVMNEPIIPKSKMESNKDYCLRVNNLFKTYLTKHDISSYPGKLIGEYKESLLKYYAKLSKYIFDIFVKLKNENPVNFKKVIVSLCGFKDASQIQCIVTHDEISESQNDIKIIRENVQVSFNSSAELYSSLNSIELINHKNTSYFEIKFTNYLLQIRVKPMNTFTTPGIKINCSLKNNISSRGRLDN